MPPRCQRLESANMAGHEEAAPKAAVGHAVEALGAYRGLKHELVVGGVNFSLGDADIRHCYSGA